jgi:RNA polymerase sigma-70 factor (ECF subfamily)
MSSVDRVIEKLYKTESVKLLAVLTRIFGPQNFDLAENVLQEAFAKALVNWQVSGVPNNPSGWLMQSAKNQAIDLIRQKKTSTKFAQDLTLYLESEWSLGNTVEQAFSETKIKDDQLRMIFACCDLDIKAENRIPFILKTLCGFTLEAVSRAMLQPVEVIKKRLQRTRKLLQQQNFSFPEPAELNQVLDKVHTVLYLLFNEGFHSSDKQPINIMLCKEAMGLTQLLIDELKTFNQDTLGLLALIQLQMARVESRVDKQGHNIPIDMQDRSLWNAELLTAGYKNISLAIKLYQQAKVEKHSVEPLIGRFYLESLIMQEHCRAKDFMQTNWRLIVIIYQQLIHITNSPVAQLNQAVAIAYNGAIKEAIEQVEKLQSHKALQKSHMPLAVLAHLNAMAGSFSLALEQAEQSMQMGGSSHEHKLLVQQIERQRQNKESSVTKPSALPHGLEPQ